MRPIFNSLSVFLQWTREGMATLAALNVLVRKPVTTALCIRHATIYCELLLPMDGEMPGKILNLPTNATARRVRSRVTLCGETPTRWSPSWTRLWRHRLPVQASLMPNKLVGDPPIYFTGRQINEVSVLLYCYACLMCVCVVIHINLTSFLDI